jgi:N-acylneuraminate cytidylyltransferase
LRTVEDIDTAIETLINSNAKSLTSVYKPSISPYWYKSITENQRIADFIPQPGTYIRRQDTENLYLLNGAIYILYTKDYLSDKIIVGTETIAYVMPHERSVDIDTLFDLKFTEFLFKGI